MGTISLLKKRQGYLLDTSTFLRAGQVPNKLGKAALKIIEQPDQPLYLSSISAYEITNKHRLGKLEGFEFIVENYTEVARKLGTLDLPVTLAHSYLAGNMDWQHRDPFDRILVAQAALENLVIITNDAQLQNHGLVDTVW